MPADSLRAGGRGKPLAAHSALNLRSVDSLELVTLILADYFWESLRRVPSALELSGKETSYIELCSMAL